MFTLEQNPVTSVPSIRAAPAQSRRLVPEASMDEGRESAHLTPPPPRGAEPPVRASTRFSSTTPEGPTGGLLTGLSGHSR
ncbi:hypothetical protein AGIG_G9762 [Arapaima gigas]